MSEEKNEPAQNEQLASIFPKDAILYNLIAAANSKEYGLELGLTLNVGGMLVSGTLIGSHTYYESLSNQFKGTGSGWGKSLSELVETIGQPYLEENEVQKDDSFLNPSFIHLKDTKFFIPGAGSSLPTNQGVLWRGKISSIDGFIVGTLSN